MGSNFDPMELLAVIVLTKEICYGELYVIKNEHVSMCF